MAKKKEEEFPLPQELKDSLLHQLLVQLNRQVNGQNPKEIADDIATSLAADIADDRTVSLSWRAPSGQVITVRVAGWLADVMDFVAARQGVSRNRLMTDALYRDALPKWLALLRENDEVMEGSLAVAYKRLDALAKRTEYSRMAERSVSPLMDEVVSLIAAMEWDHAAHDLLEFMRIIDGVTNPFWRQRMLAEILSNSKRLTMILTALQDNNAAGAGEVAELIQEWQRQLA